MIVPIAKDGSCFFRCVACFLNNDLLKSRRCNTGRLTNKTLREKENNISKFLRNSVVNLIEFEKENYEDQIYYDGEIYDNIDDRIKKMYNTNEWVGRLEIETLSNMFKIKFNIFILTDDENYIFSDSIGDINYRVCNLILDENHYQLVLDDPEINRIIEENKTNLMISNSLTVDDIISEISSNTPTPSDNESNIESNIEDSVLIDENDIKPYTNDNLVIENRPPTPFTKVQTISNTVQENSHYDHNNHSVHNSIDNLNSRVEKLENESILNQNIMNEISNSINITKQLSELISTLKIKYNIDSNH